MNYFKTMLLLAALTALFMGVGYLLGGSGGMMIAFLFALATNAWAFWNSDKVVLLRSFDPDAPSGGPEYLLDVDDPWYGDRGAFAITLAEIEAAAPGIVEHVRVSSRRVP